MKICRVIATGKIIESQSHATPGTLIGNAVAAGFNISEVEELDVTQEQYEALLNTLEVVKAVKTAEINAACAAAIVGGFASSALGTAYTYDSELEDQLNLIGAVGLGTDLPYRCADAVGVKEFRLHTAAQLKQVATDGAVIKLAALGKAATLKAQVQAAADAAAVAAVVISIIPVAPAAFLPA